MHTDTKLDTHGNEYRSDILPILFIAKSLKIEIKLSGVRLE